MRSTIAKLAVPLALFSAACSNGASSGVSDDLKKDLEASSAKLELATPNGGNRPLQFVSDIEKTNGAVPVERQKAPRLVAARTAGTQAQDQRSPTPAPQEEMQVAQAPAPAAEAPAPAPTEAPSVPIVAPRPSPIPVDMPMGGDYGRSSGGGIGTAGDEGRGAGIGDIIGIVIRGGGVGVDHCPPPRRRGRHPRIPINP